MQCYNKKSLISLFIFLELTSSAFCDHIPKKDIAQKICACVLTAAYADALGRLTEFKSVNAIYARHPQGIRSVNDLRADDFVPDQRGGKCIVYTDDTAMARIILMVLITALHYHWSEEVVMDALARAFVVDRDHPEGWAGQYRAPGNTCLSSSYRLEQKLKEQEAGHQLSEGWWIATNTEQKGCGSVMRAYPFGLIFAHDPDKAAAWAARHSLITHGSSEGQAACAALAMGIALALCAQEDTSCDYIIERMVSAASNYDKKTAGMIADAAKKARRGISEKIILQAPPESPDLLQGWRASEAIAAAVYIFRRYPHDQYKAIELGVNSTGDSDTIASLAGALVGAYSGNGPCLEEIKTLEKVSELFSFIDKIAELLNIQTHD